MRRRHFISNRLFIPEAPSVEAKRSEAIPTGKLKKVFIGVLENESFDETIDLSFFKKLSQEGAILTHYVGIARPSQPNYIALVSGARMK